MVECDIIASRGDKMDFFNYLSDTFGVNEPIFSADIKYEDYSKPWIAKQLAALCEEGRLVRYERGIYYIPVITPFGKSILNPNKVIERKYIMDKGIANGFYSGMTALNKLGFTTQIPNTIEICTNNETTKLRNIKVSNQNVTLRRSRVKITNENQNVIQFLELMNTVPTGFFDNERKSILKKLISDNKITRESVLEYVPAFPDKTLRNLVESEAIFYVSQ